MTFSLLVTSFDRQDDIKRLFRSIEGQTFEGRIEIIFVNQDSHNTDSGIFDARILLSELQSGSQIPLSKARNFGLPHLSGDIIAFPDDDCWYEPNLLANVADFFRDNPAIDCICTNVYDPVRRSVYGKRPVGVTRRVSFTNLFRLGISVGIFVRREALELAGAYFDERLGAGTPIGSGEETELLGRLLSRGCRIEYVGDIQVYHPVHRYSKADVRKSYDYGVGFGHVNGRLLSAGHPGVLWGFAEVFARSFFGTVLYLLDPVRRAVYWNRMRGILSGFLSVARMNAAIPE